MAALTICNNFGAQVNKFSQCFHYFPIYLPWSDGTRCHYLSILVLFVCLFLFCFIFFLFFPFIFISWRLTTLQYCSGFCHTLTWISHGFTCIPHPDPPSHLPLYPISLGLPSAPGPRACLMNPAWAGDLFHPRKYTCFYAVLSSPSPTESKSLFCTSVSLFLSHI